jgi:hypothetical protein
MHFVLVYRVDMFIHIIPIMHMNHYTVTTVHDELVGLSAVQLGYYFLSQCITYHTVE